MKKLILLSFCLVLFGLIELMAKEIKSTKFGGNWKDTKTWVGLTLPKSSDSVIICGNVVSDNNTCNKMLITESGYLEISKGTTVINGILENKGKIKVSDKDTLKVYELKNNGIEIKNFGVIEVGR